MRLPLLAFGFLLFMPLVASSQEANERINKRGDIHEDQYLAGGQVSIEANLNGDLVVAGGEVDVRQVVTQDILAAAGELEIEAMIGDDVRAVAGELRFAGTVTGDFVGAGGMVRVAPGSTIGGRAWIAGGEVLFDGSAGDSARFAGGEVVLSGTIDGDVWVAAEQLTITESAFIKGQVTHTGTQEAEIASGAQVGGYEFQRMEREPPWQPIAAIIGFALGSLVLGILAVWLFPRFFDETEATLRSHAWKSFGLGVLFLIGLPIGAVVLLVTFIGIPAGLLAFWVYPLVLYGAYVAAAFFLGALILRRPGARRNAKLRIGQILIGFLLLFLAQAVPVLGGLAAFFLWIFALGAFIITVARKWRGNSSAGYGYGEGI